MLNRGRIADVAKHRRGDLTAGIAVDAGGVDEKISGSVFCQAQRGISHDAVNADLAKSILVADGCHPERERGIWVEGKAGHPPPGFLPFVALRVGMTCRNVVAR